jgi:hypothetical protein
MRHEELWQQRRRIKEEEDTKKTCGMLIWMVFKN